jgi:hypothetical protein
MAVLRRLSRSFGHRLRLRVLAVFGIGICPSTAIRNCPETASPITKCNWTLDLVAPDPPFGAVGSCQPIAIETAQTRMICAGL